MKTLAVMRRILLEMVRDERTLSLIFLIPIAISSLVHFIFIGESMPV
ncbi:MAG: hypothetical protein FWJ66_03305 [Caldibacillus sp.]